MCLQVEESSCIAVGSWIWFLNVSDSWSGKQLPNTAVHGLLSQVHPVASDQFFPCSMPKCISRETAWPERMHEIPFGSVGSLRSDPFLSCDDVSNQKDVTFSSFWYVQKLPPKRWWASIALCALFSVVATKSSNLLTWMKDLETFVSRCNVVSVLCNLTLLNFFVFFFFLLAKLILHCVPHSSMKSHRGPHSAAGK